MNELVKMATEPELKFIEMVLRDLINKRAEKATGELRYLALVNEGGLRERFVESKLKLR